MDNISLVAVRTGRNQLLELIESIEQIENWTPHVIVFTRAENKETLGTGTTIHFVGDEELFMVLNKAVVYLICKHKQEYKYIRMPWEDVIDLLETPSAFAWGQAFRILVGVFYTQRDVLKNSSSLVYALKRAGLDSSTAQFIASRKRQPLPKPIREYSPWKDKRQMKMF